MRTVVEFRARGEAYCVPVEAARAVRSARGMVALPAPGADVAGLLPGDPPLTVMSPFRSEGDHVIVLSVDGLQYGLLVDTVIGLRRVEEADILPAPRGQHRELVSGSVTIEGNLVLVTDPTAMAAGL
jgi:chemotaxis signal transduction protein